MATISSAADKRLGTSSAFPQIGSRASPNEEVSNQGAENKDTEKQDSRSLVNSRKRNNFGWTGSNTDGKSVKKQKNQSLGPISVNTEYVKSFVAKEKISITEGDFEKIDSVAKNSSERKNYKKTPGDGTYLDHFARNQKVENNNLFYKTSLNLERPRYFALDGVNMRTSADLTRLFSKDHGLGKPTIDVYQYSPDDYIAMSDGALKDLPNVNLKYGCAGDFFYTKDFDNINSFYLDFTSTFRGGEGSKNYPLSNVVRILENTPQKEIALALTVSMRGSIEDLIFSANEPFLGKALAADQYQLKATFQAKGFRMAKSQFVSYASPGAMATYFFVLTKDESIKKEPLYLLSKRNSIETKCGTVALIRGLNPSFVSSYRFTDSQQTPISEAQENEMATDKTISNQLFDAIRKKPHSSDSLI